MNIKRAEQIRIDARLKDLVQNYDSASLTQTQKLKFLDSCGFSLVSYSKKKTLEKRLNSQQPLADFITGADETTEGLTGI